MKEFVFEPRTYRNRIPGSDLVSFSVTVKETDLYIRSGKNLKNKATRIVEKYRGILEKYIARRPAFTTALEPFSPEKTAPLIVQAMCSAAAQAGVGPMAAVAGAIAEYTGKELLEYSDEVIVENGGDIFMKCLKKRTVSVYAGQSPLSEKLSIDIEPGDTPLGVCTSSGTIGHSLSFGNADAVVVVSGSTLLADAAATSIGNIIKKPGDIRSGLDKMDTIPGIRGVLIIIGDQAGVRGDIQLNRTDQEIPITENERC